MKSYVLALIAIVPPTLSSVVTLIIALRNTKRIKNLRIEVNGRLTELLTTSASKHYLQGRNDVYQSFKEVTNEKTVDDIVDDVYRNNATG